jgi:hypothetical protein
VRRRLRKRKAHRLSDIDVDEISMVEKVANQHSKVVLMKGGAKDPDLRIHPAAAQAMLVELRKSEADDDEGDEEVVREVNGKLEFLMEGEWTSEDDLDEDDLEDIAEQLGIDLDAEDDDEEDDDELEDDEDDEFIELEEDTDDGVEDEPVPAMSKLSKAVEVDRTLCKAASDKVLGIVDAAAAEVSADMVVKDASFRHAESGKPLADHLRRTPDTARAIARVEVLKAQPELYDDYRQLREAAVVAVSKAQGAQEQTEALMASVKARAASLSKSDEGKGLTPAELRLKVIQSPEIAKAYRAIQFEKTRAS